MEPTCEARSGSVGRSGDLAGSGLAEGTPVQWCAWEAGIKSLATLGELCSVPQFMYVEMQEGSLADL